MARAITGNAFPSRGRWFARVSIGGGERIARLLPWCTGAAAEVYIDDEGKERSRAAETRAAVMADVVRACVDAGQAGYVEETLKRLARASAADVEKIVRTVAALCGGEVKITTKPTSSVTTYGDVAKMLTSGDLARKYPDAIDPVTDDYARDRATKLRKYILPTLGPIPITEVSLEHGHEVMRGVSVEMSKSTRKQVLQQMRFVAGLAVSPLQLIKFNPFPREFKVKAGKEPRVRGHLYPDEDKALLGERENPIAYRMAFGLQTREGMRREEVCSLEWSAVDLKHGVVRLDVNKTDDPRSWEMDAGVVAALEAWEKIAPAGPFVFGGAAPLPLDDLAEVLRECLKRAGVNRPELHDGTAQRMRVGTHDLRATFVTIASAQGRNERWISRRTGHKSHSMIATYQRVAEGLGEGEAVRLVPLIDAVPELTNHDGCGSLPTPAAANSADPIGSEGSGNGGAGSAIAAISSGDSSVELTRIELAASRVRLQTSLRKGVHRSGSATATQADARAIQDVAAISLPSQAAVIELSAARARRR